MEERKGLSTTNILTAPQKSYRPAILVGIQTSDEPTFGEELDELESLLATLGIPAVGRVIQKKAKFTPAYLLGLGKVEELKALAEQNGAGLIVIDHPLSGPQVRNLSQSTGCEILDRAGIILEIFAKHAKSRQAKTQVEIAQLEYLLPRLSGAWTHFGRQTGGGVHARGMGEKQIEIDRRRARERIAHLHKRLEHIRQERATQRKARQNQLKVAIVGYTNSGKTTLMQALTKAQLGGKDELFATLDTSVRLLDPSTRPRIFLSDTVGFIRNLPHSLVAAFKSTLEEVLNADLLLHIVDISQPNYHVQMQVTDAVLQDIGAAAIPRILLFNKADKVNEKFLEKILQKNHPACMLVSAHNREHMKKLRLHICNYFKTQFREMQLEIPAADQQSLSLVYQECMVMAANYESHDCFVFTVRAPEAVLARLQRFAVARVEVTS